MDRILLLAAALLWGGTLSAQRISTQFLGAFSFMGVRYLAGFLSMLPIVYWEQRYHNHAIDGEKKPFSLVLAAAILAIFLRRGPVFSNWECSTRQRARRGSLRAFISSSCRFLPTLWGSPFVGLLSSGASLP